MAGKALFPQIPKMLHGGDYNPEQWLHMPEILDEDIRLMKLAGCNTATLGMFSWAVLEPEEGIFNFDWLDEIIDKLYSAGIYVILGTPAARPKWLNDKYPEAMRVNRAGVRNKHGLRHNHCMTSPAYRACITSLITKMAERYGKHPALILWHISNEFGGECFCDLCQARFREYLRAKYSNDIEQLNHEWWAAFWSARYNSFEQIEPPMQGGQTVIHGMNLDWKRFTTWSMTEYMKFEIELLRKITPNIPFNTNFMRRYVGLDYNEMAKALDVISWDSYPMWNNDTETEFETAAIAAFDHSLMRGLKRDKPFMLMESVTSQVNWHPYNKLKRPGVHVLSSLQAIACGSDTVQYFQWRKGRGSFEQHHGAVIDHIGRSDTRVFKEVTELGGILAGLDNVVGSLAKPKVAIIYDWPNRWAIEDAGGTSKNLKYPETCAEMYADLLKKGIEADVISSEEDLSSYKVVIAPMLYLLKPNTAANFTQFVENGGTLIGTYLLGYVNENTLCYMGGFPGNGLKDVFGLYAEELDPLYPSDRNSAEFNGSGGLSGSTVIRDFCERIIPTTAETLAVYGNDFYKDQPVITVNKHGNGKAFYIAARLERAGMANTLAEICKQAGVPVVAVPEGVEYHSREDEKYVHHFYLNWSGESITVVLPSGENRALEKYGWEIHSEKK